MPGACELAEWNVPHAPTEHRSLLVEIDEGGGKGLAGKTTPLARAPVNAKSSYLAEAGIAERPSEAVLESRYSEVQARKSRMGGTTAAFPVVSLCASFLR